MSHVVCDTRIFLFRKVGEVRLGGSTSDLGFEFTSSDVRDCKLQSLRISRNVRDGARTWLEGRDVFFRLRPSMGFDGCAINFVYHRVIAAVWLDRLNGVRSRG